ncbi:GTP-binding protein [Schistosoma japonicum]|uniref:GTP-binding protein n=1 Tax=Schistosoma japonicum TaxID=6182 RepID=A0A4Z2CL85_SCHJA|nr:GTP-binding protein [Schistosoma japonicum]
MYETFDQAYKATIGIDFVSKTLCFNEKSVRLQLWDTAGQERFRSLIPSYIKDSFVAIVVYDVTNRDSFIKASDWIKEIRAERSSKTLVFLVGNKVDLEDERKLMLRASLRLFEQYYSKYAIGKIMGIKRVPTFEFSSVNLVKLNSH